MSVTFTEGLVENVVGLVNNVGVDVTSSEVVVLRSVLLKVDETISVLDCNVVETSWLGDELVVESVTVTWDDDCVDIVEVELPTEFVLPPIGDKVDATSVEVTNVADELSDT